MVRVELDETDHSFNKKIRSHTMRKIPVMLIVGQKEVEERKLTIRRYGVQEQQTLNRDEWVTSLMAEVQQRTMHRQAMGALL